MDNYGESTIISLLSSGKFGSFLQTSGSTCFLKEKTKLHKRPWGKKKRERPWLGTMGIKGL